MNEPQPQKETMRSNEKRQVMENFFGMFCSRCGAMFDDEAEAEDHINGPMRESNQVAPQKERTGGK